VFILFLCTVSKKGRKKCPTFKKRMWKSQEGFRLLAQNGNHLRGLAYKESMQQLFTGKRGGKLSRLGQSLRPRTGSRHSWQTQEVAPGPASLLLAQDSHLGRKHRADLSRRTGGSAFAWDLIQWDPTGSNACWICLSQKAPE